MNPDEMLENIELFYQAITKDAQNNREELNAVYHFAMMLESEHRKSESIIILVARLYEASASVFPGAAFRLGWLYDNAYIPGDEQTNKLKAIKWYQKSANGGHIVGLYNWSVASLEYSQAQRLMGAKLPVPRTLLNGDSACDTILKLYEGDLSYPIAQKDKKLFSLLQFYSREEIGRHTCNASALNP